MLPWFEVISQAPVFAAPELHWQSEAPLCTTNMYNVLLTCTQSVTEQCVNAECTALVLI